MKSPYDSLDNEQKLLCNCISVAIDSLPEEHIAENISSPVDWERFYRIVRARRMFPIAYHIIKRANLIAGSESFLRMTEKDSDECVYHNILLYKLFLWLIDVLKPHGIEIVAYKGAVLSSLYYGNVGFRYFRDVDFFIKPERLLEVIEVLAEREFLAPGSLSERVCNTLIRSRNSLPLVHRHTGIIVDVHWAPLPKQWLPNQDHDELWERSIVKELSGVTVRVPEPTDHLLFSCLKAGSDGWCRIQLFSDIAAIVSRSTAINWDHLFGTARAFDHEKMVVIGLLVARDLFQVELPEEYRHKFEYHPYNALKARVVHKSLFSGKEKLSTPHIEMNKCMTFGTKSGYLAYVLRSLFTPGLGDIRAFRVPESAYFLYGALRPFHIGYIVMRATWNRIRRFLRILH